MSDPRVPAAVPVLGYGIAAGLAGALLCCFWPLTWLAASLAASSVRRAEGPKAAPGGRPGLGLAVGAVAGLVSGTVGAAAMLQIFSEELTEPAGFAFGFAAVALFVNGMLGLLGGSFGGRQGKDHRAPRPPAAPLPPRRPAPRPEADDSEVPARAPLRLEPAPSVSAPEDAGAIGAEDERAAWGPDEMDPEEVVDTLPPDQRGEAGASDPAAEERSRETELSAPEDEPERGDETPAPAEEDRSGG